MHGGREQRGERGVYQAMTLERRAPPEGFRHDQHAKVPAAGGGMSHMALAVVDDLESGRCEGTLESCAHLLHDRLTCHSRRRPAGPAARDAPRVPPATAPAPPRTAA